MEEQEFLQEVKEISLLKTTLGLLEWDSQTGMPEASSEFRGEVVGYLSGIAFERGIGEKIEQALVYFGEHPEELSELGSAVYKKVKEEYDLNQRIPGERMKEYNKALTYAHKAWLDARKAKDFSIMEKEIDTLVQFLKEFIPYWKKDEVTNYDVLLNQYEPNLTVAKLDVLFEQVKQGIMAIRKTISEKGTAPKTDFLFRNVTKEQQRTFVTGVIEQLGYDFSRGRLDDTVHPFMLALNRKDSRITTRWEEQNF